MQSVDTKAQLGIFLQLVVEYRWDSIIPAVDMMYHAIHVIFTC